MTDRPIRVLLIGIAGLIAVAYNVWIYSSLWTAPKRVSGDSRARADRESPADVPARKIESLSELDVSQFIASLPLSVRNPFAYAGSSGAGSAPDPAGPATLQLQGTLVGVRRVAWINQRAVAEGEEIAGHVVQQIQAHRVLLRRGGEEVELWPLP